MTDNVPRLQNRTAVIFGLLLGGSLIISAIIAGATFYNVKALDNSLSVTGSARKKVTADMVRWTGSFSRSVPIDSLKAGYDEMATDAKAVTQFLTSRGIPQESINISPIILDQPFLYDKSISDQQKQYILRQNVTVQSSDVQKITGLAKDTQQLINAGVVFSTYGLEYSYSKLPDLRVELLNDAMKDAQTRAKNIAESGGKKLGSLRSASMGVVQVLAEGSNEISDYGSYDTSTINKEVMVTVKAGFTLK